MLALTALSVYFTRPIGVSLLRDLWVAPRTSTHLDTAGCCTFDFARSRRCSCARCTAARGCCRSACATVPLPHRSCCTRSSLRTSWSHRQLFKQKPRKQTHEMRTYANFPLAGALRSVKARLHMRFLMRFLIRFRVPNAPYPTLHECFFREASRGLGRKLWHTIWRHPSFQFLLTWRYFVAAIRDYKPVQGRLGQVLYPKSHRNRMKNRMCKRALKRRPHEQVFTLDKFYSLVWTGKYGMFFLDKSPCWKAGETCQGKTCPFFARPHERVKLVKETCQPVKTCSCGRRIHASGTTVLLYQLKGSSKITWNGT